MTVTVRGNGTTRQACTTGTARLSLSLVRNFYYCLIKFNANMKDRHTGAG